MNTRAQTVLLTVATAAALALSACADTSGAGGSTVGSGTTSTGPSTGGSTAAMGGAGGMGTAGMGGMTGPGGGPGSGGSDVCPDGGPGEPNETMQSATVLAGGSDCVDLGDLGTAGTIDGPGDVDWYMYVQTADEGLCNTNPGRDWSQAGGHMMRVCKYVECQVNNMSPDTVSCEDGSTEDSQGGLDGCCGTVPFDVSIGFLGCPGSDDVLNIYTRVDEPDAIAGNCNNYNLNYAF